VIKEIQEGKDRIVIGGVTKLLAECAPDLVMDPRGIDPASSVAIKQIPFLELPVGEKLGEGGFATVTRSEYQGKVVAVKRLKPIRSDRILDV